MDLSAGTSSTVLTATSTQMEVEIHVHAVIVPTTVQDWVNAGFHVRFTLGPAAPMAVMLTENGLVEFTNTPPDIAMPPQPIIAPPPGIYTPEKWGPLAAHIPRLPPDPSAAAGGPGGSTPLDPTAATWSPLRPPNTSAALASSPAAPWPGFPHPPGYARLSGVAAPHRHAAPPAPDLRHSPFLQHQWTSCSNGTGTCPDHRPLSYLAAPGSSAPVFAPQQRANCFGTAPPPQQQQQQQQQQQPRTMRAASWCYDRCGGLP